MHPALWFILGLVIGANGYNHQISAVFSGPNRIEVLQYSKPRYVIEFELCADGQRSPARISPVKGD